MKVIVGIILSLHSLQNPTNLKEYVSSLNNNNIITYKTGDHDYIVKSHLSKIKFPEH